jgi:hypothetical protein
MRIITIETVTSNGTPHVWKINNCRTVAETYNRNAAPTNRETIK